VLGDIAGASDVGAVWDRYSLDRQRAVIDALRVVTLHSPGRGVRSFDPASVEIKQRPLL